MQSIWVVKQCGFDCKSVSPHLRGQSHIRDKITKSTIIASFNLPDGAFVFVNHVLLYFVNLLFFLKLLLKTRPLNLCFLQTFSGMLSCFFVGIKFFFLKKFAIRGLYHFQSARYSVKYVTSYI